MNATKILPPKPAQILERERLVNKLRAWEDKKLVVIHGQAGQGKSSLVAGYINTLRSPSVWYNLDREDDNPSVFLSCLGQAIQHAYPGCVPALPIIPRNRFGIGSTHQGIGRWATQVFGNLPPESVIVFDDYNITDPRNLQHILKTFIESAPPQVRFMLISRMQPAIELARLRAKRSVGEITGDDLKFSDDEVLDLFGTVFGMHLGGNEVALINRTAEGWAAGLVLIHEYFASKKASDRSAPLSIRHPSGFQDHVFDYLAQEVFSHIPEDVQNFLLRTSIVDHLPMSLTELLTADGTGSREAARITDELRKKNLFVTAIDDHATIIRYHALFREFLRKKLVSRTRPNEVKRLYSIAARYFRQSGDPVRTVDLYMESGQFERAVREIESCGRELVARGQTQTLLRWTEALPLEFSDRPWLLFYRGVACRFTDPRKALIFFDRSYNRFRSDRTLHQSVPGQILSLCGIIEACFHTGGNFKRMERAARLASALLKQSARESGEMRARLLLALGTACFFIGRLRQGSEALQEALDLFKKTGDHFYQIHTAIYLTPCACYQGDLRLARDAVRRGFAALKNTPEEINGEASLTMAQAMTALFEGNFSEAQECIDKCHNLAHDHDLEAIDFLSLDIGGWLKTATGDYDAAEGLLGECMRKGAELDNAFFHSSSAHLLALTYLHRNKLTDALREAEYALSVRTHLGSKLFTATSRSVIAAIQLKSGKTALAARELPSVLRTFQQIGAVQQQANIFLLLALLSLRRNNTEEANRHLSAGFRIGQDRGFTYYYLLDPADLARLARTALNEGICSEYCRALRTKYPGEEQSPHIKIRCFGGFTVLRGDAPIRDAEWKSRRSKAMLKLLVIHDRQKIPREAIIEALWPNQSDSHRQTFTSMLHRIRKILEPDASANTPLSILLEGNLVWLNPERIWTDTSQFLSHLKHAVELRQDEERQESLKEYERAIALYQGDFLPEDCYVDWTAETRTRFRLAYLKALEEAADLSEMLGDKNKAAALYEKLFLADSCHENACRWLMSWHLTAGRRGESIRIYERCQRALSTELDVEPDHRTKSLYRSILGG